MVRLEITSADLAPNALRRWAEETPEQILLHHVDGRVLSYGDAARMCDAWAGGFHRRGIDSGSVVGIFVSDSFDCASAWLAVTSAGMIAVPMNTAHMGRMLRHVLATARMRAVVASADLVGRLSEASVESDLTDVIVHDAEWSGGRVGDVAAVGLREFLSGTLSVPPFCPELHDTAMFLFTSGSTGPSKAVVIPWAASHSHWSWVPEDTLMKGEALYAPVAMFHNSGIGALQYVVWKGGRLVIRDRFSASAFWADIRMSGAVACGVVGPMTSVLWSQNAEPDDAENPLRSLVLGPMIEQMEEFERRFGTRVCTAYGMTEVPSMVATGWNHGPWQTSGAVVAGWPWPELALVDEHDMPVAIGEVGELVVRTGAPWALNGGYFGDPAATADAWRNGWFHTGDALRQDDQGRFFFVDRMKDTIRRRGENISSFEVESVVLEHPAVVACAAFGVPDGFGGDDVMVAVVVREGDALEPAQFFSHLSKEMPSYMVPRYIDVVIEIPHNTTTLRVQKFVLRDRGVTSTTWDRTVIA